MVTFHAESFYIGWGPQTFLFLLRDPPEFGDALI